MRLRCLSLGVDLSRIPIALGRAEISSFMEETLMQRRQFRGDFTAGPINKDEDDHFIRV